MTEMFVFRDVYGMCGVVNKSDFMIDDFHDLRLRPVKLGN